MFRKSNKNHTGGSAKAVSFRDQVEHKDLEDQVPDDQPPRRVPLIEIEVNSSMEPEQEPVNESSVILELESVESASDQQRPSEDLPGTALNA